MLLAPDPSGATTYDLADGNGRNFVARIKPIRRASLPSAPLEEMRDTPPVGSDSLQSDVRWFTAHCVGVELVDADDTAGCSQEIRRDIRLTETD